MQAKNEQNLYYGDPKSAFTRFRGKGKAILSKRFRDKQNATVEEAKGKQFALTRKQAKLLQFSRKRICGIGIPDFRFERR